MIERKHAQARAEKAFRRLRREGAKHIPWRPVVGAFRTLCADVDGEPTVVSAWWIGGLDWHNTAPDHVFLIPPYLRLNDIIRLVKVTKKFAAC